MKPTILFSLGFVALGFIADAQQITFMPQAGIQSSRTAIQYNNGPSFLPSGGQLSPFMGARFDYKSKKGHGAFIGVASNRSIVSYDFPNPETGMKVYQANAGNFKMALQGGYQFSTKPMYFKKPVAAKSSKAISENYSGNHYGERSRCGGYGGHCSRSNNSVASQNRVVPTSDKGWYMSVQPSIGAAFIPSVGESVSMKTAGSQPMYSYKAGNYSAGIVSGVGFEFGKNDQRRITFSLNYLKGIANLGNEKFVSSSEIKPAVTNLKSTSSGWTLSAGIPITLNKKKQAVKQVAPPPPQFHHSEGRCGRYRSA